MPKSQPHNQGTEAQRFGASLAVLVRNASSPIGQVFSALPMALFCKDVKNEFRFVFWNDFSESFIGLSREMVIGKRDFDIWPEQVAEALRADDLLAVNGRRTVYNPGNKLKLSNGTEVWSRTWKVPIFDARGNVTAVFGLAQDITEMKNAELASAEASRQLRSVIVNAPGMFFQFTLTSSKERKFLYASRRAEELLGMSDKDLMADAGRLFAIVHENDHAELEHSLNMSVSDLSPWIWEGRVWLQREERWIRLAGDPHLTADGSVVWDGFAIDITLEKRKSESMRDHHARLANVTRMAALGQMTGGLAHELNTPLSTIFLTSELLRSQLSRPQASHDELEQVHEIADTIDAAANQMSKVIQDLRAISQSNEGALQKSIDLRDIISQSLTLCAQRLKYSGIDIQVSVPEEPVYGPPGASNIGQVLLNLLNNSIDAIGNMPSCWIRIALTADAQTLELRVIDSGAKIKPRLAAKLFEPFFTTKHQSLGTGLSLSISKHIAQKHGGTLYFDKGAGHTTFVLSLPRSTSAAA